jgi:DNA-binding MltR family transcriptional regulator
MDDKRFQQMEKRLNEQAEATRAINETLNKCLSNLEVVKSVAPPPLDTLQPVTTALKASQPSRVKQGVPRQSAWVHFPHVL